MENKNLIKKYGTDKIDDILLKELNEDIQKSIRNSIYLNYLDKNTYFKFKNTLYNFNNKHVIILNDNLYINNNLVDIDNVKFLSKIELLNLKLKSIYNEKNS